MVERWRRRNGKRSVTRWVCVSSSAARVSSSAQCAAPRLTTSPSVRGHRRIEQHDSVPDAYVCIAVAQQQQRLALPAGGFFLDKARQALWLRCAGDSWLLLSQLQQADRKLGSALDFANGIRLKAGQPERFEPATDAVGVENGSTSAAPAA